MPHDRRRLVPILACLIVSGALLAAPAPKPAAKPKAAAAQPLTAPVKGATVEGITEYTLGNGLKVLLFPDPSKPSTTVNITYLVGSINENYGETGMAHLLEHLVFKPTKERHSGEKGTKIPVDVLNGLGARFNGTTWLDRTNYFVSFPAGDDNLRTILDLEADRMVNARIAQKDLWDPEAKKGEMTVVRNEFEMGENDPIRVTLQRTFAAAFEWHNYGKSTIGARTDIENVNIGRLQAFYHKYYQPDNAVLLVAGKFEEGKTLAWVNETLGRVPRPDRARPEFAIQRTYTLDPTQDGERTVTVRRVGDVQMLMAAYHIPAGSDPAYAAAEVLGQVMADEGSGRLYKALVDTKKAGFVFPFVGANREPGLALFGAQIPKEVDLDEARGIFLKTLEGVKARPVTEAEVAKARQNILKNLELTLNDSARLGVGLSEYIALGDWRLFFLHRDRIQAVTAADVQKTAEHYFKATNRTLGQFIPEAKPERAEIPAVPDVAAMVKDYKGRAAVAQGEAFDATPAAIDARTLRGALSGGMKFALLPKKTRGGMVSLRMALHFGDEQSLMNQDTAGSVAVDMLMRGTRTLDKEQLKEAFDKLKANVQIMGGAGGATVMVTTVRENLPATVKLLAEVLRQPALSQAEFDRSVSETVTALESQKSEPTTVAVTALQKHMQPWPKGHVNAALSADESIAELKALKLDAVKAFHNDFFGAAAAEVAVAGDFDAPGLKAELEQLFGAWKAPRAHTRIPAKIFKPAALNVALETPDKANAFFVAAVDFPLKDSDPDYPALLMANHLLGGGALKSRLADRIRQKEGLSYGVGSQLSVSPFEPASSWSAFAIYNPGNVDKLEKAFREEVARAIQDGFTAEELEAGKKAWLQGQAQSRSQDAELAGRLAGMLRLDRTMAFQADLEAKVQALTPAQVQEAFRKYVDPARISVAKAGDFAKAKAAAK